MVFYKSIKKTKAELLSDSQLIKTIYLANMKSRTFYGFNKSKKQVKILRLKK